LSQVTLSANAQATQPIVVGTFWTDAVTFDGISGWEEYVIIDAAIKAKIKQEQDISDLKDQRNEMADRIMSMAEGRDAGQAQHVSDVMGINSPILSIGAAFLRYRIFGQQIWFAPCSSDDEDAGLGGVGGGAYGF
jgi:hypothetical protein